VKRATLHIGTAGFSYKDWLGNFYPQFCPQADFLRYYASKFNTVELDSTFYGIPSVKTVEKWACTTPDGFKFAAKFPRTVTHEGETKDRLAEAERFIDTMQHLGTKLGPLLLQFPYSFRPQCAELLKQLLELVPSDLMLAVELRNQAWLGDNLYSWLKRKGVSLCLIDYPGMPRLDIRTADWTYFRLIGNHHEITQDYSFVRKDRSDELDWWSDLMARFAGETVDIYGYINNHYSGHAPSTARQVLDALQRKAG
jgi:uncharacterized protein YecE (DUF72 family)